MVKVFILLTWQSQCKGFLPHIVDLPEEEEKFRIEIHMDGLRSDILVLLILLRYLDETNETYAKPVKSHEQFSDVKIFYQNIRTTPKQTNHDTQRG